ncbi:MAG: DUF1311 domain-containing protein, partial [Hyphomicrobiales bacterium]|nr:DUF1311 domain-containing protein [Hyphomicrobiales bacterium]
MAYGLLILISLLIGSMSSNASAADCIKAFDWKKKTAIEMSACTDAALNAADERLNVAYDKELKVSPIHLGSMPVAQKLWVKMRNACVTSHRADCVQMTNDRADFFDFQVGTESGEHRMTWYGMASGTLGPGDSMGSGTVTGGGYRIDRMFYSFLKPATPGERFFNEIIGREYMEADRTLSKAKSTQSA